jgi:N-acetyl sugar amidotransferase
MTLIPISQPVDMAAFAPDHPNPSTKYGLPQEIKFCARCVYSNQKPNSAQEFKHTAKSEKDTVAFDDAGVCSACRVVDSKAGINWDGREKELRDLCDRFRKNDGSYDCIVPGSGGKDSFFASHKLKFEYGMNPLTVTWAPHIYTEWGWRNFQAWIHDGFDNFLFTPNGKTERLLTRIAIETLFHPFQPFIMGQMYFPPKMAIKMGIPLVFYGENPAEYGNPVKTNQSAQKDWDYFSSGDAAETYLAGVSIAELKDSFGLSAADLSPYLPPNPDHLDASNVEVHYLGYYLRWHPQSAYYYAVENGSFQPAPERTPGTYSKYSSIDDRIDDFHYYTTYIKFGIGRATYDAAQETREGDIERDEALALIRRYDGEWPDRFTDEIFRYLSVPEGEFPVASKSFEQPMMDRAYFDLLTNRFRSPHLWQQIDGQWTLRRSAWDEK